MKYYKKPVQIEAFKFYVEPMPDWFMDKVTANDIVLHNCDYNEYSIDEAYCEISTLEGIMRARGGDYIIKGVKGEVYPCKPDIFEETYERVKKYDEIELPKNLKVVVTNLCENLDRSE